VAYEDRVGETPLLDEWCSEVGDDAVAEAVTEASRSIAAGKTLGFSDKGEFLKHVGRQHRQTA
jgi:hypothetical protein